MLGLPPAAGRLPARVLRLEISTRVSRRRIPFSIRLVLAIPRASRSATPQIAIRTTKTKTASTSHQRSLWLRSSSTKPTSRVPTRTQFEGHGTHTAGIAAGVTGKTAVVNGVNIDDMSGIAPGAWLGNYNVFPGQLMRAAMARAVRTSSTQLTPRSRTVWTFLICR